ncbi:hypothetical protein [Gulosibacter sp. ACHW.36C]|uniref:FxLD family lantipeptide n=1 Tax=Gulosibacter sediminis TaxID=1729695 RepID=A0ABY4MXK3_9MICO|nr:hypothetical protein [Gulosibacter sediminis]UQN15155.1 hypothetical protein M3M28_01415 [Gulosibacter sediminis]
MSEPRIASAQDFGDAATEAATNRAADADDDGATIASDGSESPAQLPAIQGLDGLLGGAVTATTCSIDGTCD